MKKALAFLLSAAMVLTSFVQVFANEPTDSSLEKAISKAKTIISVPADYTKFDYSVSGNKGEQTWRLTWSTGKEAKLSGNMSVSIDETGFISNFYQYSAKSDQYDTSKLPKYSRQSAVDAAKAFLEKIQPGLSSKVEEDSNNEKYIGNKNYYFNFHYVENGIPYNGNSYSVNVDGNTLEIRNYHGSRISGVTFPDKTGILGTEDIQKTIVNAKGIELKYLQSYEDGTLKIYPAYSLTQAGSSQYDAFKGEVVNGSNNRIYMTNAYADKTMYAGAAGEVMQADNLTKQELEAVEKVANVMTKEDAEKKIRAISEIGLDENYTVSYYNLYKNNKNKDQYVWNLSFNKNPEKAASNKAIDRNYISVSIDAESGSLVTYHSGYYADRVGDNKVDYDTAKAAAKKIAKGFEADKFSQTEFSADRSSVKAVDSKMVLPPYNTSDYSFTFRRVVNGIPCDSDYISVGINGKSGALANYTVEWYNGQFPEVPKDKIISTDAAYKNLFDKVGLKLYYVNTSVNNEVYMAKYGVQANPEIKLVYSIDTSKPATIDAQNGDILDSQGKPYVKKEVKPYTDINGHFSEQAIKILQEYGIGFNSEKFMPDQEITQSEFLELIMKSLDSYFANYIKDDQKEKYIYDTLIRRGIIKQEEINPSAAVSREESVKYVIRSMGLQRAAEIQGIYTSDFTDKDSITPELLGYVCIAKGLNLINGYNNYFSPKGTMTRGEAAVLLYNSLK
jgi:S-layer homology domain.